MQNLTAASREWATRPDDQRYLTIEDLKAAVAQRREESWTLTTSVQDLRVRVGEELAVEAYDVTTGERRMLRPTHWSFGQLSQYAQAPASYLRNLPSELAAINLQFGLEYRPMRDESLVLGQTNGSDMLRSMTSTSYGRIWDREVVEAVERVNQDGRWQIPAASYSATQPRRATTLYASDRDVFIFLVDPDHPVEVDGETLFRGFYTWNSEVGAAVFGLTTFLYRYVCDNRIIWDATDVNELRIRHTRGAPDRFAYEGARYLERYAQESTTRTVTAINSAKQFELPQAETEGKGWDKWLRDRGFTAAQSKNAISAAIAEEGQARSLWDVINGITASARQIRHTDERVKVEAAAGRLMKYAEDR